MRVDVDFDSYAAARWHLVVRTLVLLGVPPGHAATLARQAFARRRAEWSHQDAFDDLDAELYRTAFDLKHHDDAAWWAEPPFDDELWTEMEPELDRLTQAQREWLVLRHVAELPEPYIAAVVGKPDLSARSGVPTGDRLRDAARSIPVQPPDLQHLVALAAEERRRRRRRGFVVAAALLAVAGVVSLLVAVSARDDGDESRTRALDRVPVERAPTGSAVGWYYDGRLHLEEVILDLPDLRTVATIDDGAVYADDEGRLVQVNDQGERTVLATIGDDGTFAASDDDGLVAWLPAGEDAELVVRNLTVRSEIERVAVRGHGEVIAIDAGSVFFRDGRGDHEVTLETGEVEPQDTDDLIDVSSKVRAFQESSDTVRVVQPLGNIDHAWPGEGAQLSEEGLFVLTWTQFGFAIHDTRSGDEVAPDVGPGPNTLAAEFGPQNTITYLELETAASSGIVVVRTCSLGLVFLPSGERAPECIEEVVGPFPGDAPDHLQLAR
jgi:hypothetical protein